MEIQMLTHTIIGAAYRVHNAMGSGFLEKVYENALAWELVEYEGLSVVQQAPIQVFYRGKVVGDYYSDLLIEGMLILEIKAVRQIPPEFETQLVHYLTATGMDHGLLINFGPSVEVKHKYRIYQKGIVRDRNGFREK